MHKYYYCAGTQSCGEVKKIWNKFSVQKVQTCEDVCVQRARLQPPPWCDGVTADVLAGRNRQTCAIRLTLHNKCVSAAMEALELEMEKELKKKSLLFTTAVLTLKL